MDILILVILVLLGWLGLTSFGFRRRSTVERIGQSTGAGVGWLIGAVLGIMLFFIWKTILPSAPDLPAVSTEKVPTATVTATRQSATPRPTRLTVVLPVSTRIPTRAAPTRSATIVPTADPDFLKPLPSATSRMFSNYDQDEDFEHLITEHVINLAISGPYRWQLYVVPDDTRYADVRDYYREILTLKGYRVTYDFQDEKDIYLLKMAKDQKRVAVQFWAKQPETAPAVMVIYFEGQ